MTDRYEAWADRSEDGATASLYLRGPDGRHITYLHSTSPDMTIRSSDEPTPLIIIACDQGLLIDLASAATLLAGTLIRMAASAIEAVQADEEQQQ